MEEVTDEPLYRDRVCGIDIGKAELYATIRVPSDTEPGAAGVRDAQLRHHEAGGAGAGGLAAVLAGARGGDGGDRRLLEGAVLPAGGRGVRVRAGRRQAGQAPARPAQAGPVDSAWLAACFERGAVRSCFVPDPEFRIIRLHTRYRRDLTDERTREKNRTEKLLESAAIKLSSVVTDLHGVTGRDIMDHLIAGERNPKVLAQLARARARRKITELEHALEGAEFFTPEHAALLTAMLARIDQLTAQISELTAVIERLLAPYEEQLQQAESMPGWGRRSAQDAVAETGVDMSKFPTGGHLVLLGRPHPAGPPVRQAHRPRPAQEGQQVPGRRHRRDRRRRRQDPDPRRRPLPAPCPQARQGQSPGRPRQHPAEGLPQAAVQPRHALPGPRPGLLRTTGRHPPQDRLPRPRDRSPRPRSHPHAPRTRTRTGRTSRHPGRLTRPRNTRPTSADGTNRRRLLPRAQIRWS